jgi:hypothetical protein
MRKSASFTAEQQWITANKFSKSGEVDELAFAIKSRPRYNYRGVLYEDKADFVIRRYLWK